MKKAPVIALLTFLICSVSFAYLKARCQTVFAAATLRHDVRSLNDLTTPSTSTVAQQDLVPVSRQSLTDVEDFADEISQLLHRERFEELDQLAAKYRASKERYKGGVWRIYTLYYGIGNPWPGRTATEEDWQGHTRLVEKWAQQRPTSITARVALAEVYINYGWAARGDGYANTVSDSGWRLFKERIAKARDILEDASTLQEKCPHWFLSMQRVAQAQAWNRSDEKKLFEQAIAFEPEYLYFYRQHATFLLPKWFGEEGETAAFADEVPKRLGGDVGDIIYFDLAYSLTCHCGDEVELSKLSWTRIKSGFDALERRYGPNAFRLNQLAYMAVKVPDPRTAKAALTRLDGNWDSRVWRTKNFYDSSKEWAEGAAVYEAMKREMMDAVEENLRTDEGRTYFKKAEAVLRPTLTECTKQSSDLAKFSLYVRIADDGKIAGLMIEPGAKIGECMMRGVQSVTFPRPPHSMYWVKYDIDPHSTHL